MISKFFLFNKTYCFKKVIVLLSLFFFGCNSLSNFVPKNNSSQKELTISAASSMKEVLEEVKVLYLENNRDINIVYNFASSGSLQRQIEQGVPVDLFISAATDKVDILERKGLLKTRKNFLSNRLVAIASQNNNNINSLEDITKDSVKRIALGNPKFVPAGKYAQEMLNFFKILDRIDSKIIYAKDVRQVLNYVVTRNVDVGIVYFTDTSIANNIKIISIPTKSSYSNILYSISLLKNSNIPLQAQDFSNFLTSDLAQDIFQKYGFILIDN